MTSDEVKGVFEECGRVIQVYLLRGFAFVEYDNRSDAENAMKRFNLTQVRGKTIRLDWDVSLREKFGDSSRSSSSLSATAFRDHANNANAHSDSAGTAGVFESDGVRNVVAGSELTTPAVSVGDVDAPM